MFVHIAIRNNPTIAIEIVKKEKKFQAKNGEKISFRAKYWPIFEQQTQAGAALKKKKKSLGANWGQNWVLGAKIDQFKKK